MIATIRNLILFSVFFLFLSYPVKQKPIFNYIYSVTSPLTKPIYKETSLFISRGYSKSKRLVQRLLFNSEPTVSVQKFSDSVNRRFSSNKRKSAVNSRKKKSLPKSGRLDEHISNRDQDDLKKLFK
jgi:hypothetical protein